MLEQVLLRDYTIAISSATIGRIIKRYNFFFSKIVSLRKTYPNPLEEVGKREKLENVYAYTKEAIIHICSSCSANEGSIAM